MNYYTEEVRKILKKETMRKEQKKLSPADLKRLIFKMCQELCENGIGLKNNIGDNSELARTTLTILRYTDTQNKNALNIAYKLFITTAKSNYTGLDIVKILA